MEQKKVIDVGTGTLTVYHGDLGTPYIEIQQGYEGDSIGLYLEYEECIDELIDALKAAKSKRSQGKKAQTA